jgi:glycosyltransferase involved in cell wall biosynthesis
MIVCDNCSEDNVADYVRLLDDPRIIYYRTAQPMPVTANWNKAMEMCHGDYMIMLGDDDCLMRGYLREMNGLIDRFESPDVIHTNAFLYAYPGAVATSPAGFLQKWRYGIFNVHEPYVLEKKVASDLVEETLNFRVGFGWNMQFSLVSRKMIELMKEFGDFFQSPYPDYYATNMLFLLGERILIVPKPSVAIGITPKSFGGYYFSGKEMEGAAFLQNVGTKECPDAHESIFPGEEHTNNWYRAVLAITKNLRQSQPQLRVNVHRFRIVQTIWLLRRSLMKKTPSILSVMGLLFGRISPREVAYLCYLIVRIFVMRLMRIPRNVIDASLIGISKQYPSGTIEMVPTKRRYENILDVFDNEPALASPQ